MNKRILVIAAHPDDELLGCGGTVALHAKNGGIVKSVIVCEGESHRYTDGEVDQKRHTKEAAGILGVEEVFTLDFPDQQLDRFTLTEIIAPIEEIARSFKPEIVYCQYGGDVNRDHELLFKAILVATRPTEEYIASVLAFDTASSTEWAFPRSFVPDTWVDISATLHTKLEAMKRYESELREYPHPRSIKGLENKAFAWGNQCCMHAAEVFMTVRNVYRSGRTP